MNQVNIIILLFTFARSMAVGSADVSHILKIHTTDPALIAVPLSARFI